MSLLKTVAFGPLDVAFDGRVLAPRAWTQLQSEWGAELSSRVPPGSILELCAGAGHIGLLAAALTGRRLVQVEADPIAASYALANAAKTPDLHVELRQKTVADSVGATERFPLILADPPYLRTSDIATFPDDPRMAIDGGDDGLAVVRECLHVTDEHLADGGALLLQLRGAAQADEVARLLEGQWPGLVVREVRGPDPLRAVAHIARHEA